MVKKWTTIGISEKTKAKWDLVKERKYGPVSDEVSQDRMMDDLLTEELEEL